MNTNNIIIHTTNNESTTTVEDEVSKFKINTKVLYKGTKATITTIIPQEDEFLEPVHKLVKRLGKTKVVKYHDIVLGHASDPLRCIICYKKSGDNTEDNSFDTIGTNSFMSSNSKQLSRRSRHSRSNKSHMNDTYIVQLERKTNINYKIQQDNAKLLKFLSSSTHFSSID